MAEVLQEVLHVEKREQLGSAATRRLRQSGRIPAVLYGHGKANESLSVPADEVKALLRHGRKTVELTGALKETAMVHLMQWDPLGIDVLHLDLMRVDLSEKVDVVVTILLRGEPAGVRDGGILIENHHDVEIRCSAGAIPESVELNVADLQLGASLVAADIELPEGVELVTPAETVVTTIEAPRAEPEEGEAEEEAVEHAVVAKEAAEEQEG